MNTKEQKTLIFYGRPDGLGNRYEELALLSNFAVSNNVFIKYYWNNTGNWKYVCRIKAKFGLFKDKQAVYVIQRHN